MLTNIFLISLPFAIYLAWRIINAAKLFSVLNKRKALWISLILSVFYAGLPLYVLIGRRVPDYFQTGHLVWQDYLFTFPFWIGFIIVLSIVPYSLLLDLAQIISFVLKKKISRQLHLVRLILVAGFVIYVPARAYFDSYHIKQRNYVFESESVRQTIHFSLFSDLQIDRFTQETKFGRLRSALASNDPDLLLFAGDLVTRGQDYIDQAVKYMAEIADLSTSVACMGDHDYWANGRRIADGMIKNGWTFLQDQHRVFQVKGQKILVSGVTYIYSKKPSKNELIRLLERAPQADFKILLVHQPSELVMEVASQFNYDMMLSGHTHGGQIVINPFGIDLTPSQFENRIVSGLGWKNKLPVIVTNGVGLTLAPLRFQAPAEITSITIRPEN